MKRIQRVRERSRFQQVRREGKCWPDELLVVCALPNGLTRSRFGFSVSKQVGKAVVRNRVRRRMREAVRLQLPAIAPGWDVVFIARRPSARATYGQIAQACHLALSRAQLLAPASVSAEGITPEVSQR